MVNPSVEERRDEPGYSLDGIRRCAGFSQVRYMGRRVRRHTAELGYSLQQVCNCLASLQAHHFHHSERYRDDSRWHDVYLVSYTGDDGVLHDLYIKLRLGRDCVYVELCSFHPEGWI